MQVIATNNQLNSRIKDLELIIKKNEEITKKNNSEFAKQKIEIIEHKKEIDKKLLIIANSENIMKQICEAHLKEVSILNKEKQELQMEIKRVKYELENAQAFSYTTNSANRSKSMGNMTEASSYLNKRNVPISNDVVPVNISRKTLPLPSLPKDNVVNNPINTSSPISTTSNIKRVTFSNPSASTATDTTDSRHILNNSKLENDREALSPKTEVVRDTSYLRTLKGYEGGEAIYAVVVKPMQNPGKFKIISGSSLSAAENIPEWKKTSNFC